MPIEEFIKRASDEHAWIAADGDRLLGHVAVGHVTDDFGRIFSDRHGLATTRMRSVTTLFTAVDARGRGVGRALMELAEQNILGRGLVPVLDVVPTHATAFAMYERRGWRSVATGRPEWLPNDAPDVHYMTLDPAS